MKLLVVSLLLLLLLGLSEQKSMRIFINNAVVDVMQYLLFDFKTITEHTKYSQTSDQVQFDIRLDDGNSSLKAMDIYLLTDPNDQECYE
jgi:hypothetical protein